MLFRFTVYENDGFTLLLQNYLCDKMSKIEIYIFVLSEVIQTIYYFMNSSGSG